MNPLAAGLGVCLLFSFAAAASAHVADGLRHEPAGHHPEAGHAHPDIDLHHAIVTETPVPETELRIGYSLVRPGSGTNHELTASFEYAFTNYFSIELAAPYTVLDPADHGPHGRLGDVEVSFKYASYAFVDSHLLPAVGLSVSIPTGNDDIGVGSDHIVGVEPFLRVGYWHGHFQLVGALNVGIPFNRHSSEQEEPDFAIAYNVAAIYELTDDFQAILEIHGERTFGGGAASGNAVYVSPGVSFQPFADKSINFGVGVSLPVTDQRDFDFAVNAFMILHI